MDTYMHKTMASIASLEKIEIIRSQRVYGEQSEAKIFEKNDYFRA